MKINGLSSSRRSNTETGACAQDRSGLVPRPPQPSSQGRGGPDLALRRCWSRYRQQPTRRGRGGRISARGAVTLKDVKHEDRSGNVYENKGSCDNFTDTKDDIYARLNAILHESACILWQSAAFLSLFELSETNSTASKCRNSRRPIAFFAAGHGVLGAGAVAATAVTGFLPVMAADRLSLHFHFRSTDGDGLRTITTSC